MKIGSRKMRWKNEDPVRGDVVSWWRMFIDPTGRSQAKDDVPIAVVGEVLDGHCKEIVRLTAERDEFAAALLESYFDGEWGACRVCGKLMGTSGLEEKDHSDDCPVLRAHKVVNS